MRAAASTGSSDNHFPLQLRFVSERFFAWTFAGTPSETAEAYPDDMIDDCWIAECWGGGGGAARNSLFIACHWRVWFASWARSHMS